MKKDLAMRPIDFTSSFLSCEKDLQSILSRLFIESQPYSNDLKKLLVVNTKDCLDQKNKIMYDNLIKDMSIAKLRELGYIKLEPKIKMKEHEEKNTHHQTGLLEGNYRGCSFPGHPAGTELYQQHDHGIRQRCFLHLRCFLRNRSTGPDRDSHGGRC